MEEVFSRFTLMGKLSGSAMIFATDVYGSGRTKPSYMEKYFIVHFAEKNVFR
jgi:hypothetical protein